ncbi:hypothetical protein RSM18_004684 [Serratia marcescens]|nr:hypothetical protein [Serratia marcescens]ELI8846478.1 hypothetical protein [Serratia marcescens]
MGRTAISLVLACAMLATYAHAGFNGNQGMSGKEGAGSGAGNSNVGVCLDGNGQNAGQCVGESNGVTKPKQKDKSETLKSICSSPFVKKYAAICQ